MPRESIPADAALAAELAARGVEDASERKVERARQSGMLPAERVFPGAPVSGSQSVRADDEVDRAIEAFALLAEHGTYRTAFLAMFVDGKYVVSEEKLRAQLLSLIDDLERSVRKLGGGQAAPAFNAAFAAATWAAERARRGSRFQELRDRLADQYAKLQNLGQAGYRHAPERLTDFFTEILHIPLTGKPTSRDEGDRMLEITGVGQILDDPYTGTPNRDVSVEHVWEWFEQLALARLRRLVTDSTSAQLEQARDDTKAIVAFARAYGTFLTGLGQRRIAFAWVIVGNANVRQIALTVPAMVAIRAWRAEHLDEFLEAALEWTPGFTAFAALLDTLPDDLVENIKRQQGNLDDDTKSQLAARLNRFAVTDPELYIEAVRPRPQLTP